MIICGVKITGGKLYFNAFGMKYSLAAWFTKTFEIFCSYNIYSYFTFQWGPFVTERENPISILEF